jgi:RNA polymerase sigma-70 factor (ECF subfamily)
MACHPHAGLAVLLPRLVVFARTRVGSAEIARDLVQEAAVRALTARRVPDDPSAYRAWMFRIVRNAAIDEIRRRRTDGMLPLPAPPVDVWRCEEGHIARLTLERGLAGLPRVHRETIALIDIAGFSYAEAAGLLHVPIGTVMSRVARARAALYDALQDKRRRRRKERPLAQSGQWRTILTQHAEILE